MDEILQAQQDIGKAIDRAHAGEDKDLARRVRESGEQFARLLYGLLRMTRIHDLENRAFEVPIHEFREALKRLYDLLGTIHLVCVEDQVYVNDVRIRFNVSSEHVTGLVEDLRRHGVGGLSFNEVLSEPQIKTIIRLMVGPPAKDTPRTALQKVFIDSGMGSVDLQAVFRFRVKGETAKQVNREFSQVYTASAGVVADAYSNLVANRLPNPLPVRRMVNELIDTAKSVDAAKMGREYDERLPNFARHTLMVTNLSVLIGREAGLSDASLGDLGTAAMFHDVGMSMREDGFAVPYERHTSAGLRQLIKQRGFHEAKIRRLLTVVEHHRPFNHPGQKPTLFARIIHIADDFDILTRYRPGRGPILSHPDTMVRMASGAGTLYDPFLWQCFVNVVGLFPPGSLLKLESGALVLATSGVRSKETFDKPMCRVIQRADRSRPKGAEEIIDLAIEDKIVRVVRPSA